MNVLVLSQFYSTTRGGGEYMMRIISEMLADRRHSVTVITNRIDGEAYGTVENVRLVFVPPVLKYAGGLPPSITDNVRYVLNAVRTGAGIIRSSGIDVIHSNNFSPAVAGSVLSRMMSVPHVTSIWDVFSLCGDDYWARWAGQLHVSRIHRLAGRLFERQALKARYDAIHTVSAASREDIEASGARCRVFAIRPVITDGTDAQCEADRLQFVFVGRLIFYKNVQVLLEAVRIVRRAEPGVRLVIIGSGPQRNELCELVHTMGLDQNVRFAGFVDAEEKARIISGSNAMLFPSLCEGFGLVMLEAFAQGRPVIASDMRPMSDIISHGVTGLLADPHDAESWAGHMVRLVRNPEMARGMGARANRTLKTEYTQDRMYEELVGMYEYATGVKDMQ